MFCDLKDILLILSSIRRCGPQGHPFVSKYVHSLICFLSSKKEVDSLNLQHRIARHVNSLLFSDTQTLDLQGTKIAVDSITSLDMPLALESLFQLILAQQQQPEGTSVVACATMTKDIVLQFLNKGTDAFVEPFRVEKLSSIFRSVLSPGIHFFSVISSTNALSTLADTQTNRSTC